MMCVISACCCGGKDMRSGVFMWSFANLIIHFGPHIWMPTSSCHSTVNEPLPWWDKIQSCHKLLSGVHRDCAPSNTATQIAWPHSPALGLDKKQKNWSLLGTLSCVKTQKHSGKAAKTSVGFIWGNSWAGATLRGKLSEGPAPQLELNTPWGEGELQVCGNSTAHRGKNKVLLFLLHTSNSYVAKVWKAAF